MSMILKDDSIQIREVWKENLEAEMVLIREIVDKFPYVAMDTEFPGTVYKPVGTPIKPTNESTYETLRANVNLLKIIQLGLTFSDDKGNLPTCGLDNKYCIWQFNFREFDLTSDMYAHDSIELLRQSGIDFVKNRQNGVDSLHFADLLMSSGVVLNDDVHWVTFHGGYDFGYLLKLLTGKNLPQTQSGFLKMISVFFPRVYDVKHVMKFANGLYGGLNKLAQNLGVKRVGTSHQAGSDSLLTLCVFMKLQERYFIGSVDKYSGVLFGLGVENR